MATKKYEFTDEDKADYVARYMDADKKVSAADLAKEAGCSTPTMVRNLKAWGATIRPKGRIKGKVIAQKPTMTTVENVEMDAAEHDPILDTEIETDTSDMKIPTHSAFNFLAKFIGR